MRLRAPNDTPSTPAGKLNLLVSCAGWRSDSWADALPTLLEPMGVSAVRARSGRQAERVIRADPVHIAIVDLGLPLDDEEPGERPSEPAGVRILELLRRLETPPPTVVVKGAAPARDATRSLSAALRSDAFAVVDRTAADVELMLRVLHRALRRFYGDRWPDVGKS